MLVVRSSGPFWMQYPSERRRTRLLGDCCETITGSRTFPEVGCELDPQAGAASSGYLTDDPGVLEGQFAPAFVASAHSAMARNHLGLEQDLTFSSVVGDMP